MKEKNRKYSIGLDIGTNSVGWAVTDCNYNLLKWKGKNMWGVRLFDAANTAEGRRISRSTRRRYNKRRERIYLLKQFMNEIVEEVDNTFFIRMEHTSFLNKNDKVRFLNENYKSNYNLFIDQNFNDKTYYELYPTIFHLRKHLCECKEKVDPRLLYLALHHIVKYRGNFLHEGQSFSVDSIDISDKIEKMFELYFEKNSMRYDITNVLVKKIIEVLKSKDVKKNKVDDLLANTNFEKEDKVAFKELYTGLVGNAFNVLKMFSSDIISIEEKELKLKFSDANYDTKYESSKNQLEEVIEIIDGMKEIHSWVELQEILDDQPSISTAMVKKYDKHEEDLRNLKLVIKKYCPDKYNSIFKSIIPQESNYYNYIHHAKEVSSEMFCASLKKILLTLPQDKEVIKIIMDIEVEKFLPKQNDRSNGAIPYQLQLDEMKKILENQQPYYNVLKKEYDKILKILTFRIPYYYGPLNTNSTFAWLVKQSGKENERILPWNHESVVDVDKTAEQFIGKMRNFCTYIKKGVVLAENSLVINKYELLAELNKIRVNDKLLAIDVKNKMINELFMNTKKITDKRLKKWFIDNQVFPNNQDLEIRGYQKDKVFSSSMSSWIDFTQIFGEINSDNFQLIEEIIYDITVFEDKKILKRRLKTIYKGLSIQQITQIMKLKYSGWSRLSQELLTGIRVNNSFGGSQCILDVMEKSNYILQEIITNKKLGYKKVLDNQNNVEIKGKFTYTEVQELVGSPAIKKGIWQSLLVVDEIRKAMKCEPENVYIEFAREIGEKVRTDSRIKKLQEIYEKLDIQNKEDQTIYQTLKKMDNTIKIDSDRLYLYYMQMGKCMYSGKSLGDIDNLSLYEIDHIVPQSLIKDDSFDNRVLVIKKENQRKLDNPVISWEIQDKMKEFWKKLYNNKLISSKKYFSLIKTEFHEKEQIRFINRQLVETRQITKHVTNIINNHYKSTKVITIKAGLLHDFRMKYGIWKNREVNDFHHAHDGYIACVLGTYIYRRFPQLDSQYIYGEYQKINSNKKQVLDSDGFILNSMNNDYINDNTGEVVWSQQFISSIKKCFDYKDYYITKKLEVYTEFFDSTMKPNDAHSKKKKTEASVPVNKYRLDVQLYGGYSGVKWMPIAIMAKKGNKVIRQIVGFPVMLKRYNEAQKIAYISQKYTLTNVKILKENICKNQLIQTDKGYCYITAPSELVSATQLHLPSKENHLVYLISKSIMQKNFDQLPVEEIDELYQMLVEKMKNHYLYYANYTGKFESLYSNFKILSTNDKCIVILEILTILKANAQNGNITLKNFSILNRIGRLNGKTIDLDKTYFIEQSITGLYRKKYRL